MFAPLVTRAQSRLAQRAAPLADRLGYSTAAHNSAPRAQWSFANTPVFSPGGSPQSQHAPTDGVNLKGSKHRVTDQGPDAGTKPPPAGGAKTPPVKPPAAKPTAAPPGPVTAVAFGNVNAPTTPAAMNPRIPPRIDQSVGVTITGSGSVDISVDGGSATNGKATIDGAATKTLAASGPVKVRGTDQTAQGSAGKLKLVAKSGGHEVGSSNAFTVCAIPTTVTVSFASLITGDERGIEMTTSNNSDSGHVSDLDKVQMSEKVKYVNGQGAFDGITSGDNSSFLPANASPHGVDHHGMPVSLITGAGKLDSGQVFVFNDDRSGAAGVSVEHSGFNIHRQAISTTAHGATTLSITTTKTAVANTVDGSTAKAGSGGASKTQAV